MELHYNINMNTKQYRKVVRLLLDKYNIAVGDTWTDVPTGDRFPVSRRTRPGCLRYVSYGIVPNYLPAGTFEKFVKELRETVPVEVRVTNGGGWGYPKYVRATVPLG